MQADIHDALDKSVQSLLRNDLFTGLGLLTEDALVRLFDAYADSLTVLAPTARWANEYLQLIELLAETFGEAASQLDIVQMPERFKLRVKGRLAHWQAEMLRRAAAWAVTPRADEPEGAQPPAVASSGEPSHIDPVAAQQRADPSGAPPRRTAKKERRYGPKPNKDRHAQLVKIVRRYGDAWASDENLLKIGGEIDKADPKQAVPQGWRRRKDNPCRTWYRAAHDAPDLMKKAIHYSLRQAEKYGL